MSENWIADLLGRWRDNRGEWHNNQLLCFHTHLCWCKYRSKCVLKYVISTAGQIQNQCDCLQPPQQWVIWLQQVHQQYDQVLLINQSVKVHTHHFQDPAYSKTGGKLESWGIFQFPKSLTKIIFNFVQAPHRWLDQNGSYIAFLVYSNNSVRPTKADVSDSRNLGRLGILIPS